MKMRRQNDPYLVLDSSNMYLVSFQNPWRRNVVTMEVGSRRMAQAQTMIHPLVGRTIPLA